ncbi:hypothetical protein HIM_04388 [Hirsutella minnesotensis 3608]|uniref:Protein kinase domain-containing protein n=1 Tax=Hirsutella minnesotensis 3608 TaxID=1043627 RepID=A0A0F7ZLE2_9HYPO|nr:hypothetical protein HIM_04388 [Hirsutella minnesotensis 3608]
MALDVPAATVPPTNLSITIKLQLQHGLELIGVGSAGQVYNVDHHIVFKSGRIFKPLGSSASKRDAWFFASESIFHFNLMRNERHVLQMLERWPHPNLVQVIDVGRAEGIYLRKYRSLKEAGLVSQSVRISWYQDILRGLLHLHGLGIAHADLRADNVLLDGLGRAILCDFSASRPFNKPNPAHLNSDSQIPINGLSELVSSATDMFAMATLIFHLETGHRPCLSVGSDRTLVLPDISTGNRGLDSTIRKAWIGEFDLTIDMLNHVEGLQMEIPQHSRPSFDSPSKVLLQERVRLWRADREAKYGCVLTALPAEAQLKAWADHYSWDLNEDYWFQDYKTPGKCF